MGHEVSGVVLKLGDKVDPATSPVQVGDQVVAYSWFSGCQKCKVCTLDDNVYCAKPGGLAPLGIGSIVDGQHTGGYSSHVILPNVKYAQKVPAGIPMDVATMLPCSGLTTYTALMKIKPNIAFSSRHMEKPSLLVLGTGGLGCWCTVLARYVLEPYKVNIICADTLETKRELARAAGADQFVLIDRNKSEAEVIAAIRAAGNEGVDAAVDFVGLPQTASLGFGSLRSGGKLIEVGLHGGNYPLHLPDIIFKAAGIEGSFVGSLDGQKKLLDLVAGRNVKYPDVEKYKLDAVNTVLDKLRKGEIRGRAVLDFTAE